MRLSYHVFELSRAFTLLITQYLLRLCYYSLIYFFNGSIYRLKGSQLDDYHSVPSAAFKHHLKHVSNRPFTHSRVADFAQFTNLWRNFHLSFDFSAKHFISFRSFALSFQFISVIRVIVMLTFPSLINHQQTFAERLRDFLYSHC